MRCVLACFCLALLCFGCSSTTEDYSAPQEEADAEGPPEPSPPTSNRGKADLRVGSANLSIDYGRPVLQGRDMLSRLQDGAVWRLGMNEATSFTTDADLKFGMASIKAGAYSLFLMKASPDEFHLVFNQQTGIWGTAYDPASDVAHITLEKSELDESVEQLTIELAEVGDAEGEIIIRWDTLQLKKAFSVQ